MYHLYILECSDKSLYTGITTDIKRRLAEHKAGKASHYTSSRGAVKIVYTESCGNRSKASKREIEVKKLSRKAKIELIKNNIKNEK